MKYLHLILCSILVGCTSQDYILFPKRTEDIRVLRLTEKNECECVLEGHFFVEAQNTPISHCKVRFKIISEGKYKDKEFTLKLIEGTFPNLFEQQEYQIKVTKLDILGIDTIQTTNQKGRMVEISTGSYVWETILSDGTTNQK